MALARLGGPAVASSVMGDDAIAVFEEEQHLRVPVIGRQRPAMAEDDGLSFAPIFIIDVDVSAVLFPDCYVWHFDLLSYYWLIACRALSRIGTRCGAPFHRSKLQSNSPSQRHDAR